MYNEALSRSFNFPTRGRCHEGKQDCKDKGSRIPVRKDFIVRSFTLPILCIYTKPSRFVYMLLAEFSTFSF